MNATLQQSADLFDKLTAGKPAREHLCLLAGGSTLYGLDTEQSDLDLRGVYLLQDLAQIYGLPIYGKKSYENCVVASDAVDACTYDLRKFMYLLSKTNTQVVEILYADPEDFHFLDARFVTLIENREKLIDSEKMFRSLMGYIQGERRLMTGERTGLLGGKRKEALCKYGYSYKNLVQILRLGFCGCTLFQKGYYPAKVARECQKTHDLLISIKTKPWKYNIDAANVMVDAAEDHLKLTFDGREFDFKFDSDFANDYLLTTYGEVITKNLLNPWKTDS